MAAPPASQLPSLPGLVQDADAQVTAAGQKDADKLAAADKKEADKLVKVAEKDAEQDALRETAKVEDEELAKANKFLDSKQGKELKAHLQDLLNRMLKLRWIMRRLTTYLGRLQLLFQVSFIATSCISAVAHSFLTIENSKYSHVFMGLVTAVHAGLVALYGKLDPGHWSGVCGMAAKGYDLLVTKIQAAMGKPISIAELHSIVLDIEKAIEMVIHSCGYQPPQWVIDECSKMTDEVFNAKA
eukprot:gnl/TRDRNA2_/TRDRNA2_190688_c0_seq1.p1 gnl/TRDRNA2_/TRDRNA2_190688_c0~~gnl/TRDRNA2_/TRDRNA2_190688_c0_seq1.p1  ORF type:complete len:249 (+),score=68.33 gnl/TRDRNA2_/TRDRNA2_190688_c0_seq1:23-748(+)